MFAARYIKTAKQYGFRTPEDVKVIGYDGIQNNTLFHPILSTIPSLLKKWGECRSSFCSEKWKEKRWSTRRIDSPSSKMKRFKNK
ncbi:hypothetical protein [Paenibacillus elgii]|uniref:hypothetical protein n=1 Tax=Paenibacillus elgii TaxID=189691 RepID=UPI00030B4F9D|nr:hypothetical protein [Paenibacillus elgii]